MTLECANEAVAGSYQGCEFIASPLPNLAWGPGGTPSSPLGVVVANTNAESPVSVSLFASDGVTPAPLIGEVTVTPGPSAIGGQPVDVRSATLNRRREVVDAGFTDPVGVEIPPAGVGIFLLPHNGNPETTSVRQDTYWVRSDRPIVVYQFGPYCCNFSHTNDASLLLPTTSYGSSYRFLGVPSWGSPDTSDSPGSRISNTISVIASAPDTTVTIELAPGASITAPAGSALSQSGETLTARLEPGDVLSVYGAPPSTSGGTIRGTDLSGTSIRSDSPVAVFSGHECTYYPWDRAACDHLEEQLLPVETWGRQYLLVPPALRSSSPSATETTYWKFLAVQDGTAINLGAPLSDLAPRPPGFIGVPYCGDLLDGTHTIMLDAGEHCELGTRASFAVDASAPIQVLGVISGSDTVGLGARTAGDPALFGVPPKRQLRSEYVFLTPTTYALDYVTITTPPDNVIILDGVPVDLTGGTPVMGDTFVSVTVPLEDGAHRMVGDMPFGILVYAYDDWVSYAFTGGLNLLKE
jgi:hypothetical protein